VWGLRERTFLHMMLMRGLDRKISVQLSRRYNHMPNRMAASTSCNIQLATDNRNGYLRTHYGTNDEPVSLAHYQGQPFRKHERVFMHVTNLQAYILYRKKLHTQREPKPKIDTCKEGPYVCTMTVTIACEFIPVRRRSTRMEGGPRRLTVNTTVTCRGQVIRTSNDDNRGSREKGTDPQ